MNSVDLGEENNNEVFFMYAVISSRLLFRMASRCGVLNPVTHTVMSSALQTQLTGDVGLGMVIM